MNAILGMTGLCMDTDVTPEQFECLDSIKQSAETLLALVDDILDLTKIEAGSLHVNLQPIFLKETLNQGLQGLAYRAQLKGLQLSCLVEDRVHNERIGDPTRLRQILLNLVGNSIKFTETGSIRISIELDSVDEPELLHFSVADTGIGIRKEMIPHLFDPFRQVRLQCGCVCS